MLVKSLNIGKPRQIQWQGRTLTTSIFKEPVLGPLHLGLTDFEGNEQGDLVGHGGPDKAANVYFFRHYRYWERFLARPLTCGAFGENLTLMPGDEEQVCIGDVYELGGAVVEVSQPRGPCFKIDARHNAPGMAAEVIKTGFTGLYFRVLSPGTVAKGDRLELLKRPFPDITISFANRVRHSKADARSPGDVERLSELPVLAKEWRRAIRPEPEPE